jgi:triacylglycerol lipase
MPSVGLTGVNDPDCHSTDPPVLLLHGTLSTPASNFGTLAPALRAAGRCVYAIEYGARYGYGGIGSVRASATEVAAFARQVLELTGAGQLDVVGYSQGGLVARTMLRYDLDPSQVRLAVLVAPSYHGTTSAITANVPSGLCPACKDQTVGSALLTDLATGGDLAGNVRYAVLSTRNDVVVTPVSSQVPQGPTDRVRSTIYEEHCSPGTDHVELIGLRATARWVVGALASDGRPTAADLGCS